MSCWPAQLHAQHPCSNSSACMYGAWPRCAKQLWQHGGRNWIRKLPLHCKQDAGRCYAACSSAVVTSDKQDAARYPQGADHQQVGGRTRQGRLELLVGPMFAGKTTRLIDTIGTLPAGTPYAAVKSDKDVRYGISEQYTAAQRPNGFLHTHDGRSQECYAVSELRQLKRLSEFPHLQAIFIDEGHFFTDLKGFCDEAVDEGGKQVYVAGLDSDFERHAIGQVNDLCPRADKIVKLTSRCAGDNHRCTNRATFTWRTVPIHQQEFVGGSESYQALCRSHYLAYAAERSAQQRRSLDDVISHDASSTANQP